MTNVRNTTKLTNGCLENIKIQLLLLKKSDDDDDYLLPNNLSRSNSKRNGVVYENFEECRRGTFQSDATQKVQKRGIHQGVFMEELKLKIDRTCISAGSVSSASCDASSYLSVRDGDDCFGTEEYLSVRGEESLYANENDTGNSSDNGNTSPVTTYETPEMPGSLKPYKFKRKYYMCHGKGEAKRELKQKPVGVFAVFPGESGELNERVSLFELHQSDTFSSLDSLLTFYHKNALPRKDYSVKLQKGYKTMY
ncbi:uncharacterized protein LOC123524187 isoform X2 [Mercenaria mercenaria]|uniref:uncharacterized protein LOC123524187 isoform X2 n=1 Tax=Mercenaria mercenaria TaxID=6596 RepID=UPI00234EB942|nr:uncharacterized protein LOC123524187 isoform X2 [Mercenaria mercenaria]